MSLPPAFTNAEEYFEEFMAFLKCYRDLYCKPNTDVLTKDLNFHIDLVESDDLESLQHCYLKHKSTEFSKELERFAPRYEHFTSHNNAQCVKSPMSEKKAHEVIYLTDEIEKMCHAVHCKTVVDLGAGLGYVDLEIHAKTGFNVLGLEGNEKFYARAKEHQRKYHLDSIQRVKYIRHIISEDSNTKIATFLEDKFPGDDKRFCFMGLHACGDLSVSAINLFLKMEECRALVVTPCCYHKMEMETSDIDTFRNFPLSATLKKVYDKFEGFEFLKIPFFRVAAQPSYMKNEDIQERVFCLLARALLTVYAKKHNCQVQKRRRRAVHLPVISNDFTKYAEEAIAKGFKLVSNQESSESNATELRTMEFNLKELQIMWENIPKTTFKNAALYISYQNYMPPTFENLILYDRLVYLKEQGIHSCYFKKVVDEEISPKCLSLFAYKENGVVP